MEFKIPHLIVVPTAQTTLPTAGTSTVDLTSDRFGLFDATSRVSVTTPALPTNNAIFFAQYSGDNEIGTYKSPVISARNVKGWRAVEAICTGTNQITYVGFDEVDDNKTLVSECDEYYSVTIRLINERFRHISPAGFTKSYSVKTSCCTDCATPCTTVDCKVPAQTIVDLINNDPYLRDAKTGNPFITASVVSKCTGSADTKVFALTLPDPGTDLGGVTTFASLDTTTATGFTNTTTVGCATTALTGSGTGLTLTIVTTGTNYDSATIAAAGSGYKIGDTVKVLGTAIASGATPADDLTFTITGTDSPEGTILDTLRTMYSAFVTTPTTDIVITSDVDGAQDTNSTGNIRYELTPITGTVLSDLQDFNGVKWEEIVLTAGTETCICGIKIVGNSLDEFGNACVPSAFPFIFDAVRFNVFTSKGPASTNDFEVYEPCDAWQVNTVQVVQYPIGSGKEYAELERENFQYWNKVKRNYINPLFNLWTPKVDPNVFYDAYFLEFAIKNDKGFSSAGEQNGQVIVLFEHECPTNTKGAIQTAFETAINGFVAEGGLPALAL